MLIDIEKFLMAVRMIFFWEKYHLQIARMQRGILRQKKIRILGDKLIKLQENI